MIQRRHIILYGCIAVSLFQASMWVMADMPDKRQGWVIVIGIGLALIGSHDFASRLIPLLAGLRKTLWMILPVVAALSGIFYVEKFSISTSAAAFDGNMMGVTVKQNQNSPERAQYQSQIDDLRADIESNKGQIEKVRDNRNSMQSDWRTNRQDEDKRIDRLKYENKAARAEIDRLQKEMNSLNVSAMGRSFENLESSWLGMSQEKMALLFALLMSLVPLLIAFLDGADTFLKSAPEAKREAKQPPKKNQRPNLASVKIDADAA